MRLLFEKQGVVVPRCSSLTERHRAPKGVPAQAQTWVGGEGTQSPVRPAPPAVPQPAPLRTIASAHSGQPKTLKERLQWMADNLPGFREEMEMVEAIRRSSVLKGR